MMVNFVHTLMYILLNLFISNVNSFNTISNHHIIFNRVNRHSISMRDGSSRAVFYQIGDKVKVVENVYHSPPYNEKFNSLGLEGIVKDIWEKCEIDPHCCCAELAFDAPIEVLFNNNLYYPDKPQWTGFYSEDEIQKVNTK